MEPLGQKIDDYLKSKLWEGDAAAGGKARSLRIKAFRLIYVILKGFTEEQLILRAMSLVYTTLLSFVPLLAVSFSVLKAFGAHTRFVIFLYYFLEPLGDSGTEISMKIIGFVENVNVKVLGSIGISLLIYTVISTVQKIESALNYIWNISSTRGFSQRFSNYMSVLLVGPVLILSALGITATLMSSSVMKRLLSIQAFGELFYAATRIAPYVLISAAFTAIYIFLPNTRVRFRAALVGGVVAAILWQTIGWIFTSFIASSAQYSAIYSGFAALILLLIWLYWNYLTLLIGARVSFYTQYPRMLNPGGTGLALSSRSKEKLALVIMLLVGQNFHAGGRQWKSASLTQRLGLPAVFIQEILAVLEKRGLLVPTQNEPPSFLPAKELESVTVAEIIGAARGAGDRISAPGESPVAMPEIDDIMAQIEKAITSSAGGKTLKDLVMDSGTNHP